MRGSCPFAVDSGKHLWGTLGPVGAASKIRKVGHFCQRSTEVMEFDLPSDLGHELIKDIQQMPGEFILESQVIRSTTMTGFICPRVEPLVQSIRNKDTVADPRKSLPIV